MSDNVDKPDDQRSASSPETPEVEAEIVTDDELVVDTVADSGGAFDDTHDTVPPARKSTLTLGVILFILFAVAAVAVFAVWRFQSGSTTPDLAEATPSESIIETPPSASDETEIAMVEAENAPEQPEATGTEINSDDAASFTIADDGDNLDPQIAQVDPAIDAQTSVDDAESLVSDFLPAGDGGDAVDEANGSDLPSADAMDDLITDGALDLGESTVDAPEGTTESTSSDMASDLVADAETIEIAEAGTLGPDATGEDLDALTDQDDVPLDVSKNEATDAALLEPTIPDLVPTEDEVTAQVAIAAPKIDNDGVQEIKKSFDAEIARLEDALAAEREQNATQREQIEEMRRNFQAALAARDRNANQQITALNARLDKIENGNDVQGGRRAAAALALNNLRQRAEQGEPFTTELDVLAGYLPQGGEIATLRRYAEVDIPMKDELETAFSIAAREALAVAGREAKTGLGEKLSARITSLVSVRPAEPIEGDSARAIISRAEAFIEAGDIRAGANELGALVDGPRTAMADWLALAQARIAVDGAIASLGARLAAPIR